MILEIWQIALIAGLCVLSSIVVVVSRSMRRRNLVCDTQPFWHCCSSEIHVVTLVDALSNDGRQRTTAPVAALVDGGGAVVLDLAGNAVAIPSKQLKAGVWDVLVTRHSTLDAYQGIVGSEAYQAASKGASPAQAFEFKRVGMATDVILPNVFAIK